MRFLKCFLKNLTTHRLFLGLLFVPLFSGFALSSSVSAVTMHQQAWADLFQWQKGDGAVIQNYGLNAGFNYFPIYSGEVYDRICFHYNRSYGSNLAYIESFAMNFEIPNTKWTSFSAPSGSALNYTDTVTAVVYNEGGRIYYQYVISGTTISSQQTCYNMTLTQNSTGYIDVGFNQAMITTYDDAPSVGDIASQISSINGKITALVTDSHAIYQELQANRIATDNIRDAMIYLAPDVADIKDILSDLGPDITSAINDQTQQQQDYHDETKDTFDDAQDSADADGQDSSDQANSTGTTLLGAFIQFVGALTGASAGNCIINANIGDFRMGDVDLCQLDPPPAFQVISSLMVIGFAVPLSIALGKKLISMFRSFQR